MAIHALLPRRRKPVAPPTPKALTTLKESLNLTGKQMAELAGVGEQHWRKYTGGKDTRTMSTTTLFHLAAQLELTQEELSRIVRRMEEIVAFTDDDLTPMTECTAFMKVGRDARRTNNINPEAVPVTNRKLKSAWLAGWYTEDVRQHLRDEQRSNAQTKT